MIITFAPERLAEFQGLCAKHYGKQISKEAAEVKFTALVRLLMVCSRVDEREAD